MHKYSEVHCAAKYWAVIWDWQGIKHFWADWAGIRSSRQEIKYLTGLDLVQAGWSMIRARMRTYKQKATQGLTALGGVFIPTKFNFCF